MLHRGQPLGWNPAFAFQGRCISTPKQLQQQQTEDKHPSARRRPVCVCWLRRVCGAGGHSCSCVHISAQVFLRQRGAPGGLTAPLGAINTLLNIALCFLLAAAQLCGQEPGGSGPKQGCAVLTPM